MTSNIAATITYLLPGFLAYWVYRMFVTARQESDFILTVKSLLWSIAINVAIGLKFEAQGLDAPEVWQRSSTIVLQLLLALITGVLLGWLEMRFCLLRSAVRWVGTRRTYFPQIWQRFFAEGELTVYVRLNNGSMYYGTPTMYTESPDEEPKELQLESTWFFEDVYADPIRIDKPVYLRTDSIAAIEIAEEQSEQAD